MPDIKIHVSHDLMKRINQEADNAKKQFNFSYEDTLLMLILRGLDYEWPMKQIGIDNALGKDCIRLVS